MARRKRQILEDDDSDSSPVSDVDEPTFDDNDPDARAERELFENPYKRKRRRKNAKEDAIYGVFASDDDEEDEKVARRKARTRTKAPAFVSSSSKMTLDEDVPMEDGAEPGNGSDDEDGADEEEGSLSSDSEPSKPPSPRVREEEEEQETRPRIGGLGMGMGKGGIGSSGAGRGGIGSSGASKGGIGSSKAGIGNSSAMPTFSKAGIGSSRSAAEPPPSAPASSSPSPAPVAAEDFPTAFGGARTQRSFVRNADTSTTSTRSATPLSAPERAHFSKISGTFGARMLAKMGWQAGQGLGTTGEGIVTPVESKLRPKGMGIAFKGFKEKTEQSKAEARRRGEIVSDDEEDSKATTRKARKAAKAHEARTDAWKKPKKTKTRVEHKTYEEIISEAGQDASQAGVGPIIDATGATVCVPCSPWTRRTLTVLLDERGIISGRRLYGVMDPDDRPHAPPRDSS